MACGHTLVAGSGQGRELILPLSKFPSSVSVKGASAWGQDSLLWEFGGTGELQGIWKATVNSYVGLRNSAFSPWAARKRAFYRTKEQAIPRQVIWSSHPEVRDHEAPAPLLESGAPCL